MPIALATLLIVAAYLIGSIPFGYLVAQSRGVDIFAAGSGNIGATNVGRTLGRKFGILVFLLDFAKGAIPTWYAKWLELCLSANEGWSLSPGALPVLAGLGAFFGHLYPLYLGFKGGKGVATGAGVVAVLLPIPALGGLLTWVVIVLLTRYVSLASLTASVAICVFHLALTAEPFVESQRVLTVFCFVAALLVFWKHRANIRRLLSGTESRIGGARTATTDDRLDRNPQSL